MRAYQGVWSGEAARGWGMRWTIFAFAERAGACVFFFVFKSCLEMSMCFAVE